MLNTIYATKDHQTQAFVEGRRVPVTILKVEQHTALNAKTIDKDGYSAQVFGIGTKKKAANKPMAGFLKKLGLAIMPRIIREVRTEESSETLSEVNISEVLTPGSTIKISAVSKGKGTAGVMKRHGFHGGPRTHGQSDRQRHPGSIGRGTTPGRVVKGHKMAGHMGSETIAIRNLKVHSFDAATGKLEVTGLIPGARGTLAQITVTKKA
jgi:large subunit ribosomal protein L3